MGQVGRCLSVSWCGEEFPHVLAPGLGVWLNMVEPFFGMTLRGHPAVAPELASKTSSMRSRPTVTHRTSDARHSAGPRLPTEYPTAMGGQRSSFTRPRPR
jgi:hypothetical protein